MFLNRTIPAKGHQMQTNRALTGLGLILAMLAQPAWAQTDIDTAALQYVAMPGFEVLPMDNIEAALNDLLGADPAAMVPADADISPIEKAFLLIDTQEVPLVRMRYVLRYNETVVDGVTLSLIDIERYNLGPAIRAETALEYGEENTAELEAFGVGPHVEWRFVTQATAKSAALLLEASRREIDDEEAAARSCLPRTCLSLDPFDGLAAWSDGAASERPLHMVSYPALGTSAFDADAVEIVPAYQALELGIAAGIASADDSGVLWTMPQRQGGNSETPLLVVVVDRNLGQDIFSDAALGIAKLGKAGDEHWVRINSGYFDGGMTQTMFRANGPLVQAN